MSQFSSHHNISLEKSIDNIKDIRKTVSDKIIDNYEIPKCIQWIQQNGFQKVCLQFPNKLLPDSTSVALEFEKCLKYKVYILGDTAYESCCVDYVAAEHISADAIIHYGESCFSQLEQKIPVLNILEKKNINDVSIFNNCILKQFSNYNNLIYIVCDKPYKHLMEQLQSDFDKLAQTPQIMIMPIENYCVEYSGNYTIFIGKEGRMLTIFYYTFKIDNLFIFDPENSSQNIEKFTENSKIFKRRYYLIELVKDSKVVGIVVGTLSVKNYLEIINRIKALCKIHGKKSYIISVGKPNVAKLANFPEIDLFCMVACPQNEIYDSREFYKPIVSPYDIELALNPNLTGNGVNWDPYDYNKILLNKLPNKLEIETVDSVPDVSLVSGKARVFYADTDMIADAQNEAKPTDNTQVAVRSDMALFQHSVGAQSLSSRSWKGLEPNLGADEPKLAETGRKGLAKGYSNEL